MTGQNEPLNFSHYAWKWSTDTVSDIEYTANEQDYMGYFKQEMQDLSTPLSVKGGKWYSLTCEVFVNLDGLTDTQEIVNRIFTENDGMTIDNVSLQDADGKTIV